MPNVLAVETEPSPRPVPGVPGEGAGTRLVTWRSLLAGLAGVLFVNVLTPFNDYLVNNTSLVGSALPMALVLFVLFLTLAVNIPLRRWWPAAALRQGELAVAIGMTLVSCAIPGSALLKYVPAHIVGLWNHAGSNDQYRQLLDEVQLPGWMLPTMEATDSLGRAREPVIQDYIGRTHGASGMAAVPWRAWVTPAITWGALFACIFGAGICMAALVRRQWVENERLTFPLATLCVSLIEAPRPGRLINDTFRSRWFLVAFAGVFLIHALNGLNAYFPRAWPAVPLGYDISGLFVEEPWRFVDNRWVTRAKLSFLVIGVTYFVTGRIAFSVWFCMVGIQVVRVVQGLFGQGHVGSYWPGGEIPLGDHLIGCLVPYVAMVLWLGRREWAVVLRRMLGRRRPDDPQGAFLPYGVSGWGMVLFTGGMFSWLLAAGAGWIGSTMLVTVLLMLMLALMRIVAETGVVAIQFMIPIYRPWQYLFNAVPSLAADPATLKPFFLTRLFNVFFTVTQRESLPVFASHGMQMAAESGDTRGRQGVAVVGAMALALVVGYLAGGSSLLYMEYNHAATLDKSPTMPVNEYGVVESARYALDQSQPLMHNRSPQRESHNVVAHVLSGAGVTSVLAVLSVRFAWWPIHPLGYLLLFSWTTWAIWFSVMLGWAIKALVLRLGGTELYRTFKPAMVGFVLGECAAVGFWLVVSLVCVLAGWNYEAVNILPF